MKAEYDIANMKSRPNPYAKQLKPISSSLDRKKVILDAEQLRLFN